MQDKNTERDDFWDLAKLVPKKRSEAFPFTSKNVTSDYLVAGKEQVRDPETKLSFDNYKIDSVCEERSYTPSNYYLIKNVTVRKINDKYDFYGSFRKAAEVYFDYKTEKCEFATFYSYMPQYSQLTKEQKNYYFYWRDMIRKGKYIKTDYSYIYLYAYEILNLPEKIPPKQGIVLLCTLWREYREVLRRIDSYFSVWVQDYCLIYDLKCPMEIIGEFIFDVIEVSTFKEFYLSDIEETLNHGVDSLVAYLSDYDWRRGKYVGDDHAELYKKCMRTAMSKVICEIFGNGVPKTESPISITREAFPHSLCTHAVKCRLTVEYYPVSRDAVLREIFTGSVRYTENKLRALIGIKSRLAVKNLDSKYKKIIDDYFSELVSSATKKKAVEYTPEYERLYEAPKEIFSSVGADKIERLSWNTTIKLVPEEEKKEIFAEKTEQNSKTQDKSEKQVLTEDDVEKIKQALSGGFSDDFAADRINETFYEWLGDVVLESDGKAYVVIEDYREDVLEWLKQMK